MVDLHHLAHTSTRQSPVFFFMNDCNMTCNNMMTIAQNMAINEKNCLKCHHLEQISCLYYEIQLCKVVLMKWNLMEQKRWRHQSTEQFKCCLYLLLFFTGQHAYAYLHLRVIYLSTICQATNLGGWSLTASEYNHRRISWKSGESRWDHSSRQEEPLH